MADPSKPPVRIVRNVPNWNRLRLYALERNQTIGAVLTAWIAKLKLKGEK